MKQPFTKTSTSRNAPSNSTAIAAAGVAGRNIELAPVPANARLGIAPPERLVSVRLQRVVPNKRQLHRPVVRQVQFAPFRVVVSHLGKFEVAGLGEVVLAVSESEILGRVGAVAELKLPSKVEEQLLARGESGSSGGIGSASQQGGGASPMPSAP